MDFSGPSQEYWLRRLDSYLWTDYAVDFDGPYQEYWLGMLDSFLWTDYAGGPCKE